MTLAVTTYFWRDPARDGRGYQFNHDHVRILKSMVERNLTLPHRFVCVTDDEIDGIETVPLDWSKHVSGTCFIRLMQRRPDYGEMIGADRVFNLDLDIVITGNIDAIVGRPEPSVFWRNPNFPAPRRAFYQTSVQLFTPGDHSELYTDFDPERSQAIANRRFGGAEQAWVSEMLPWDMPYWDHRDGIYGAGRIGDWQSDTVADLPPNARIVSFPGARIPDQDAVKRKFPWIERWYR
jgi:hypothetical protein